MITKFPTAIQGPDIGNMLAVAFTADEMRYLVTQSLFRKAWAMTMRADEFEQLCFVGEGLLSARAFPRARPAS